MARRPKHRRRGIKRGRICDWPADAEPANVIADKVSYTGSALHKTYPSPAGPPAKRSDKAKCDVYEMADWPRLLEALREAIRFGCVGEFRGGFPSRVWVWINDVLHEAKFRLSDEVQGDYHGFPVNDARNYPSPADRLENAPRVNIAHR
jgi:hypothetical protein